MASLNQVQLIGNVGAEPKITTTQNGAKMAQFSLATTERAYTTKSGTQVPEKTEWHNIVLWRGLAEIAEKYIHKGSSLFIQGKMRTRSYDDNQGVKRYITEVEADMMQMLGAKPQGQQAPQKPGMSVDAYNAQYAQTPNQDPDLPF
jgi:single-strand DNA-binding protein